MSSSALPAGAAAFSAFAVSAAGFLAGDLAAFLGAASSDPAASSLAGLAASSGLATSSFTGSVASRSGVFLVSSALTATYP